MMKKISILFSLFIISFFANAQKNQNVYFFKNNGQEVKLKDSADYTRIIQEPDSGETNFVVQEFYANGKRKLIGKASAFDPLVNEGVWVSFNGKGKKTESISYEKGNKVGMAYHFFNNGTIYKQLEYLAFKKDDQQAIGINSDIANFLADENSKLIFQADSNGVVLVKDGTGHVIETSKEGNNELVIEGDYKDGFKEGLWKGKHLTGNSGFEEIYQANKLVSGIRLIDGKEFSYKHIISPPQFKKGVSDFYRYIGNAIRYPADAARNNVTGKVVLSFVVDKDGSITDVFVVRSVSLSIDQEAKRVLISSPKWIPALERGLPIRVRYSLPIGFNLGK